jgi:hypothetical protein
MPGSDLLRRIGMLGCAVAVAIVSAAALGACGSSGPPEKGLLITGPGIRATPPPWPPQYQGLAQRIKRLGLPPAAENKFHIHAVLSIYNNGLYVPTPANIGLDKRHSVESSLHTHDQTGIIHMEGVRRFPFTLGDFFDVWGVRFGAGTLGTLQDDGKNRVWVYVNHRLISDPARYVLKNGDSISIGYGPIDSFSHYVAPVILKKLASGELSCGAGGRKKQTSCLAPTSSGTKK